MFSGIINMQGTVAENLPLPSHDHKLGIVCQVNEKGRPVSRGDSIAVNGVCLTVTDRPTAHQLLFDVSAETARCTTLGDLRKGDRLNLESALRVGDALNGHWVTGHVDCVATVSALRQEGRSLQVQFEAPPELMPCIAPRGSVCLDGVSLTVVRAQSHSFTVNIIPYTAKHTSFADLECGRRMNLEIDILARYLQRLTAVPDAG